MHAQTTEAPQLEIEDVGGTVIPFRPRLHESERSRQVDTGEQSRAQTMQTLNDVEVGQARQFPLYRCVMCSLTNFEQGC
jgi:hypothetical protein